MGFKFPLWFFIAFILSLTLLKGPVNRPTSEVTFRFDFEHLHLQVLLNAISVLPIVL